MKRVLLGLSFIELPLTFVGFNSQSITACELFFQFVFLLFLSANMNQSIVCGSPCEDTKYSIDIKEEPLDAPSVTDIDTIKHDSPCAIMKDEIDIKETLLECIDESNLNFEMRSYDPLNLNPNSSNSKVGSIKYSFEFALF